MNRLLKQIKSEDGGIDVISFVFTVILALYLLAFLTDLIQLGWKFNSISQLNTNISRQASIQGGVLRHRPNDYPSDYIDVNTMHDLLESKMKNAGVADGDWEVRIGRGRYTSNGGSSSGEYEFKEHFDTSIRIRYNWNFVSALIPGRASSFISSKRPCMSEWHYNHNDWAGE